MGQKEGRTEERTDGRMVGRKGKDIERNLLCPCWSQSHLQGFPRVRAGSKFPTAGPSLPPIGRDGAEQGRLFQAFSCP